MDPSYAAGLIDGEGYLGIGQTNHANTYYIRVQVSMVTKGTPILSRLKKQWGGRMTVRPPETERNVAQDAWVVDGKNAHRFLSEIRPYLVLKRDQADCCIQLWEAILTNRGKKGRHHWDDELRRHAHHLMLRVQEGNRRGPVEPTPEPLSGRTVLAVRRWGEWWEPEEDLFGPRAFTGRLPTFGSMRAGRIYPTLGSAVPPSPVTPAPGLHPTPTVSDANGPGVHGDAGTDLRTAVSLLPTPNASDSQGGPRAVPERRTSGGPDHGPRLRDVAPLLPTPTATPYGNNQSPSPGAAVRPSLDQLAPLLPTPRATDGTNGGPNQRGSSGDLMLPSAPMLLPTPTAMDSKASGGSTASDVTLTDAVVRTDLGRTANPRLLPTPRAAAESAATRQDSRSAPSLGQAVEIAQGLLPLEFTSWEELPPSWRHGRQLSIEED